MALLFASQSRTRDQINERFDLRADIASRFVATYVDDLVDRQRDIARRRLAAAEVGESLFERTVADGGYEAAVLLDSQGRLLRVAPPKPELLGKDLTADYDHLRQGVEGDVAISGVVPSASRGIPVVAFAVPFATAHGRRVYSGAYDVSRTPLGSYLRNAVQITPNRVYLLDRAGTVVASNRQGGSSVRSLDRIDPGLTRALAEAPQGEYDPGDGAQRYASRNVAGAPWRVVIAVPQEVLYSSVGGLGRWLPWLAVAAFALVGLLVLGLLSRLMESRARLATMNVSLERLSRVDPLTGLHNRRHLEEVLEALVSAGNRHDMSLSVLVLDIDHFKRVNDTHGHQVGDEVLTATASVIKAMLRTQDAVARWGGEEFLVALPGVGAEAAVAERMRTSVTVARVESCDDVSIGVTVTIGVAVWNGESVEELLKRADAALYRGKAKGRDRVEVAEAGLAGLSPSA